MKRLTVGVRVCGTLLALLAALVSWIGYGVKPAAAMAAASTYVVNSTADQPDADVGDGLCLTANGGCTLRAAIMQANFLAGADTITLPAGTYQLTRPGNDDAAVLGDLDITDDLTIQGAGSGVTIVDGNGTVTADRVFQILASAKETTFSGLTIRNGQKTASAFDEGGGLYWDGGGGHLLLSDVVIENNAASYGGGIYLNYSTLGYVVDMNQVIVRSNSATAAAGGLGVNFGDSASFSMLASQVYSNTAYEGGGIFFQGTPTFGLTSVSIANSSIYSNTASLSAGFENRSGSAAVPVRVQNSHIYQNHASFYGGGIGNYGTLAVSGSVLDTNTATTSGGGIYIYEGGQTDIQQSTLSGNQSKTGGGIYSEFFLHNTAGLTLTNSTLSGNSASQDGGAIYADGGQLKLFNATVADNHVLVPMGTVYTGMAGGVYISNVHAVFSTQNSLLANNDHRYQPLLPVPDDCFGPLTSLGFNLIRGFGSPPNCIIGGDLTGNIIGQDPLLGPLATNGGSTQTQSPLTGSPAVNAGQTPSCTDVNGAAILTDQRGFPRSMGGRCDIGAVEQFPYSMYLPVTKR